LAHHWGINLAPDILRSNEKNLVFNLLDSRKSDSIPVMDGIAQNSIFQVERKTSIVNNAG